jgi:predicted ATPase
MALWTLGYPDAALADTNNALCDARAMGQAATLMFALLIGSFTHILCGDYAAANAETDEVVALASEKGAFLWKAFGMSLQGCLLALTGKAADAVNRITAGIAEFRSTGATCFVPLYLAYLTRAYAELSQSDDAGRCIDEAMQAIETSKERWCEAEVYRTAGEIALMPPEPDAAKAQAYFQHALAVASKQTAKSWELRAAMSMARLWRDQGKRQQAHDLLAPVYGWFTEGFDTLDLKEARAVLDALAS